MGSGVLVIEQMIVVCLIAIINGEKHNYVINAI